VGYLFYISRVGGHSSVKGQIVGYIFLNFSKVVQTNHEYRYMVQVLVIVVFQIEILCQLVLYVGSGFASFRYCSDED